MRKKVRVGVALISSALTPVVFAAPAELSPMASCPPVVLALLGLSLVLCAGLTWRTLRLRKEGDSLRGRLTMFDQAVQEAVFEWDLASGRTWYSPRWGGLLGEDGNYRPDSIEDWRVRIHPEDLADAEAQLRQCLASEATCFVSEHRLRAARGNYLWVKIRATAERDADGRVLRLTGSVSDISLFRQQADELQYQAMHDRLTRLPNRALFLDRLQQGIIAADRETGSLAIVFMDLDRFKEINETLGHPVGDAVLRQIAPKLRRLLRGTDTIARLGDDEFAILLPTAGLNDAKRIAANIHKALDAPLLLNGESFYTSVSIGVSVYPEHGGDAEVLMRHADVAMCQAKQSTSGVIVYDAQEDKHSISRLTLSSELRHAIDHDELELYYQPKISLGTGKVASLEALVRWNNPKRGMLMPDLFIPLAEQTGLIRPLARWVIREALGQCARWRESGFDIGVAVNLSVRNLQDPYLPQEIQTHLARLGVDAAHLNLEITESAMMQDPVRTLDILSTLYTMGVRLSVDDFGTGYSSLNYLKRMPVSEIKIDKSFVMDMHADDNDASIVRATIDMAHSLGLRVVAEGVENPVAQDMLQQLGCDSAQGYHFSRPLPAEAITAWMQGMCVSGESLADVPLH